MDIVIHSGKIRKRFCSSNVDEGVLIQSERGVLIKSEYPVLITLEYSMRVYRLECLHVELSLRPRSSDSNEEELQLSWKNREA